MLSFSEIIYLIQKLSFENVSLSEIASNPTAIDWYRVLKTSYSLAKRFANESYSLAKRFANGRLTIAKRFAIQSYSLAKHFANANSRGQPWASSEAVR